METLSISIVSYTHITYLYSMDTKNKIIIHSMELFMKLGIRSVSIDDICRGLGISKKTIYVHFKNKRELVNEVIHFHIQKEIDDLNLISENSKNAIDEMIGIAKYVLEFLRNMSPTILYDLKKYYSASWKIVEQKHMAYIESVISNNLKNGKSEGYYREAIDEEIVAKLYVSKSMAVVDEKIFSSKAYKRFKLYEELIIYHMYGIVSDKGRKYIKKVQLN